MLLLIAKLGLFSLIFAPCSQSVLNLDEDDVCLMHKDGNWRCVTADNCRHANVRPLRVCSQHGRLPIICCPPKKQSKAEQACANYRKASKCPAVRQDQLPQSDEEDDLLIPLVIGGTPSSPKSHPEIALLGTGLVKNDITWQCGGSLISDRWILSAAHCEYPNSDRQPIRWVRLGELDQSTSTDDARPIQRQIVRRVPHPQFKLPEVYHDIALYEMDSPVTFSEYVAPVCLHMSFDIESPKATVVGWGRTGFAEDVSSRLLEADITLINHTTCVRLYGKDDIAVPHGIDRMAMVCAGERKGGKDACKGDSGSALLIEDHESCLRRQVGIVSTGKFCGLPNVPGVYTRVSTYVSWIESIVWP